MFFWKVTHCNWQLLLTSESSSRTLKMEAVGVSEICVHNL